MYKKLTLPKFFQWLFCLVIFCCSSSLFSQKMLLLERANSAKTTKMYIGDRLIFRLAGDENYWYERTITDILPEGNSLLLDNYLVKVSDIAAIKVNKKGIVRIAGGALLSLGISLGIATSAAALYQDKDQRYPVLLGIIGGSLISSRFLLKKRKLYLNEKHRLRPIEIKFEQ